VSTTRYIKHAHTRANVWRYVIYDVSKHSITSICMSQLVLLLNNLALGACLMIHTLPKIEQLCSFNMDHAIEEALRQTLFSASKPKSTLIELARA